MRVLYVAMSDSIHAARWITQVQAKYNWDIHLFSSIDYGYINPTFKDITVYHSVYVPQPELDKSVRVKGWPLHIPLTGNRFYNYRSYVSELMRLYLSVNHPKYHVNKLVRLIQKIKPHIIHSMEFQRGAYLVSRVRDIVGGENFPQWIATNWGSDLHLYGRLADHRPQIEKVLSECDFYSCECERDVQIARGLGFKGEVLPVMPNAGGFDLDHVRTLRQVGKPSERRTIILKGYQHFAGRALVALKAVAQCADILKDYRVAVFSPSPEVTIASELLAQDTGLQIDLIPKSNHEDMLRLFGESRVYMGLSISDAISTSMLEALVMGAFPIQSNTACTDEWFQDGVTGFAVPPEDPYAIADALRRAIDDDQLVDTAAEKNWHTCVQRLDHTVLQSKIVPFYQAVIDGSAARN